MSIFFHSFPAKKEIPGKAAIKKWIKEIISDSDKKIGDINIIFVTDKELLEINQKYLNHSYYTDIITFNYNTQRKISGDIYISLERIMENSFKYQCSLSSEVLRVIIHGILHLLGFNDKTKEQKSIMKKTEDDALRKFPNIIV